MLYMHMKQLYMLYVHVRQCSTLYVHVKQWYTLYVLLYPVYKDVCWTDIDRKQQSQMQLI